MAITPLFSLLNSFPGAKRPKWSMQGQGGAAAQLQKIGEKIASGPVAKKGQADVPAATGENPMAPQPARPRPQPLAKASPLPCTFPCSP